MKKRSDKVSIASEKTIEKTWEKSTLPTQFNSVNQNEFYSTNITPIKSQAELSKGEAFPIINNNSNNEKQSTLITPNPGSNSNKTIKIYKKPESKKSTLETKK